MVNKFFIFLLFFNTFFVNSMETDSCNKLPKKDPRKHFLSLYSSSCGELPEVSSSLSDLHSKEEKVEIQRTFSSSFENLHNINILDEDIAKLNNKTAQNYREKILKILV